MYAQQRSWVILTREPSYREVSARQQCVYEGP